MRSGLAPAKPRRTSSMRDQANNNNNNNSDATGTGSNNAAGATAAGLAVTGRIGGAAYAGAGNGVGLQRHPGVERQRPLIADLQERLAKVRNFFFFLFS